ncbi:MAG: carboxypeptidase regulatory-like domain-containing protein, partial [Acidobacteria bacterium]|nr:carboxypeptidase regulatory-like domain-containing protein [Acidobacteriota bacterium]
MKRGCIPRILVTLVSLAFLSLPLAAQSGRGTITGVVKDASGAVVPGADILIVEKATGVQTKAFTTEAGVYRAPYLPPGKY